MKKINIQEFLKQFNKEYSFLYEHGENVAGYSEAVAEFDECLQNENFKKFVGEFVNFRKDFISSDREAAAFMFALATLG